MLPKIIIYTSQNCPYSKRLKDFLYKEGIPFEEINASNGVEETKKLMELDKELRTPIIRIMDNEKEEILLGWNEDNKRRIHDFFSSALLGSSYP